MTFYSFAEADLSITRTVTLGDRALIIRGLMTMDDTQAVIQLMNAVNRESYSPLIAGLQSSGYGLGFYVVQLPGGHHIRRTIGMHFALTFIGDLMSQETVMELLDIYRRHSRI